MAESNQLPDPDDIAAQIRARREELAALKRLHRLALAARNAREATEQRKAISPRVPEVKLPRLA